MTDQTHSSLPIGKSFHSIEAWLKLAFSFGPISGQKLLSTFKTPEKIFQCTSEEVLRRIHPVKPLKFFGNPDELNESIRNAIGWIDPTSDQHLLSLEDPNYPPILRQTSDPPIVLFAKGKLSCLSRPMFAIVGSREATHNGCQTAFSFSHTLSQKGLLIVSGLAEGIDAASHRGALHATGQTVAVVGTGIDRVFPRNNVCLFEKISEFGVVLSEFPLQTPPRRQNFPRRNRIIAGLSMGVLVVEAAPRSGSLITAHQAVNLGREVMAVPGSIHSTLSKGCHTLIKEGAKLVETVDDILSELKSVLPMNKTSPDPATCIDAKKAENLSEMDKIYEIFLNKIGWDPIDIDSIAQRTQLPISEIRASLTILELAQRVERRPDGKFVRVASL